MNKKKLGKGLMVVCISTLVALICLLFVFFNFRAHGMYYASQYYGRNDSYKILKADFDSQYSNEKQRMKVKGVFQVSKPDKGSKVIFLSKDEDIAISQDNEDSNLILVSVSDSYHSYLYDLQQDSRLHFYTNPSDNKKTQKKFFNEDRANFEYYLSQYIDIQLKAVGKPKINLQWIYNIVQMI